MASKLCIHTIYYTLSTQQAALSTFLYLHNFSLTYSTGQAVQWLPMY